MNLDYGITGLDKIGPEVQVKFFLVDRTEDKIQSTIFLVSHKN